MRVISYNLNKHKAIGELDDLVVELVEGFVDGVRARREVQDVGVRACVEAEEDEFTDHGDVRSVRCRQSLSEIGAILNVKVVDKIFHVWLGGVQ